jgi:hypothetical protein
MIGLGKFMQQYAKYKGRLIPVGGITKESIGAQGEEPFCCSISVINCVDLSCAACIMPHLPILIEYGVENKIITKGEALELTLDYG